MALKLYLLGSPRIESGGVPIEVDTRKAIALLVYLVVTGEAHSRDSLATLLWPNYDQSSARAALRRTLSTLRKALNQECLDVHWEAIGLLPGLDIWSDVAKFRSKLSECSTHGHSQKEVCPACIPLLTEAVSLYRDHFLSGFTLRDSPNFDEWQFFQTENFKRELEGTLEKLARGYCAKGEFESAIACARRWSVLDPLREEAHRQLMLCFAWAGQRNAALRQYREFSKILEEELGVPPLEETAQLYQAILENQTPPLPQIAAGWSLIEPLSAGSQAAPEPLPDQSNREPAPSASYPFPLVGRSAQSVALVRAYDQYGSKGYFMVLEGEAGIGKTRLAEEFLAYLRAQGATVIASRCYEGETNLAYGPFIEGLTVAASQPERARQLQEVPDHWLHEAARLLPGLIPSRPKLSPDSPPEGPGAQSRFFEGLRQTLIKLCEGPSPGVLFLDDLNWADTASIDLLTYLVRRLRGSGMFILVTWRSETVPAIHRLHQLIAEVQREGYGALLSLNRLESAEVADLVRSLPLAGLGLPAGFPERIYRETEGLPFFIVEYLENIAQELELNPNGIPSMLVASNQDWPIPHSVRDLLRSRLATAGETGRQLLSTAAVIGRSFDFNTLREASGRSEMETLAGLEVLLDQGLIVEQTASENALAIAYDFVHDKMRTLVLEDTSLTRKRLLHRRVAEALINQARSSVEIGPQAAQIAYHYHLAGQDSPAADYFKKAGEHARSIYANFEAVAHFKSALTAGHPNAVELHEAIGDVQVLLGEYSSAQNRYELAASLSSEEAWARLGHKLGVLYHRRGEWDLAVVQFQAALKIFSDQNNLEWRARLYADWSRTAHQQGETGLALQLAHQAVELAEKAGNAATQGQAYNILGILARKTGDLSSACQNLTNSLSLAQTLGDPFAQVAALNNLALVYRDLDDLEKAVYFAQTALELCTRHGDRHHEAALHNNLADLYHAASQPELVMDHLKKAVVIFSEIGIQAGETQPEIWKLTEW